MGLRPHAGTTKRDLAVIIRPDRLTVSLSWAGRVLDGPLAKPVRASDAVWALDGGGRRGPDGAPAPGLLPPPPQWRGGAGAERQAGATAAAAAGGAGAVEVPEECVDLMIVLPKAESGRFWKALFEGGPEKSYWEVRTCLFGQALVSGCPRCRWHRSLWTVDGTAETILLHSMRELLNWRASYNTTRRKPLTPAASRGKGRSSRPTGGARCCPNGWALGPGGPPAMHVLGEHLLAW